MEVVLPCLITRHGQIVRVSREGRAALSSLKDSIEIHQTGVFKDFHGRYILSVYLHLYLSQVGCVGNTWSPSTDRWRKEVPLSQKEAICWKTFDFIIFINVKDTLPLRSTTYNSRIWWICVGSNLLCHTTIDMKYCVIYQAFFSPRGNKSKLSNIDFFVPVSGTSRVKPSGLSN